MNNLIAKLRKPEDDRGSIVLWTVIIAFGLLLCLGSSSTEVENSMPNNKPSW